DQEGQRIIFQNKKGYEDYYRKHEKAAITRDIWMYDLKDNSYKQLTSGKIEHRVPYFSADQKSMYYLSQSSGDFNVYKRKLEGNNPEQLTHFEDFPVRSLSLA